MKRLIGQTLALLLCGPALAQSPPATVIRDVAVFDGERSVGRRSVLLEGGRIADPDFKGATPAGATIVDGKGRTLLPGLIDAHVHAFQGLDDPLFFGVTTQLDMFASPEGIAPVRARMKSGTNSAAADLFSAGILATAPGGHGSQYGFTIPTLRTPAEADAWVAARIAEGSDYIKIVDEPGSPGRPLPTLDRPTIAALITAAHKRGKLAVVHAQSLARATSALEDGADGLVHLFFDADGGASFAALAKRRNAFVIPTYSVIEVFSGRAGGQPLLTAPAFAGLLPKAATTTLAQKMGADRTGRIDPVFAANITALAKTGVPVLAGTDAGNPGTWYGISLHRELQLLVMAGLTPTQAITAATAAPARAFRLADRGRIAKGLKADLVLVEGDPTANIDATQAIVAVWKDGNPVGPLIARRRAELLAVTTTAERIALPASGRILEIGATGATVTLRAPFGLGWTTTTDAIAGGKSVVTFAPGAQTPDGLPSVRVSGELRTGFMAPWSGIAFNPGAKPFEPVDISAANTLKFRVRGTGGQFAVFGFTAAGGAPPAAAFTVAPDWREVAVRFAELKGFDPAEARLLTINAVGTAPAAFTIEIADVRLVRE